MAHEKKSAKDSLNSYQIKREELMMSNNIEVSVESIFLYNQLKAGGSRDKEIINKMKERGY